MKSRSLSGLILLCCSLLWTGASCNDTDAVVKEQAVESLEVRRFFAFAQKNELTIPTEKQYYIIIQPKMCVSCVGYYLREISSHIPKESKLVIIGKSEAQKEVLEYIDHPSPKYFSNFNSYDLNKEPFMKSGIAYAISQNSAVMKVVAANKTNIKNLF